MPSTDDDTDPGSLHVVRLSGTGPATTGAGTRFDQEDAGLPGTGERGRRLRRLRWRSATWTATATTTSSSGRRPRAWATSGAPGGCSSCGAASRGLATSGNTAYDQDTPGVPGGSESGDGFGGAVTLLDRDGDGRADLTIGAPGEDDDGGRVTTLLAAGSGFTTVGSRAYGLSTVDNDDDGYDNGAGASFGAVLGR